MPGFNGLGPKNIGPMTGKGRGYCIKRLDPEEKANFSSGFKTLGGKRRGMGKGNGMGLGKNRDN